MESCAWSLGAYTAPFAQVSTDPRSAGQRALLWLAIPLLSEDGSQQPDAILLQQLPFADDMRSADMPSFDSRVPTHQKKVKGHVLVVCRYTRVVTPPQLMPSAAQVKHMAQLVAAMDLDAGALDAGCTVTSAGYVVPYACHHRVCTTAAPRHDGKPSAAALLRVDRTQGGQPRVNGATRQLLLFYSFFIVFT